MKQLRFVVSLPSNNNYQQQQAAGAMEAARQLGADVQVVHSDSDAVKQSQQILEVIQSRSNPLPDAILFEPLTSTGLVRAGEAAVAAGIGWVVLNSDVDYMERLRGKTKAPVFIVTRDHTEIGRIQGRQFEALLPAGGSILYIQGPANSSAAIQRTIGLESTKPAKRREPERLSKNTSMTRSEDAGSGCRSPEWTDSRRKDKHGSIKESWPPRWWRRPPPMWPSRCWCEPWSTDSSLPSAR